MSWSLVRPGRGQRRRSLTSVQSQAWADFEDDRTGLRLDPLFYPRRGNERWRGQSIPVGLAVDRSCRRRCGSGWLILRPFVPGGISILAVSHQHLARLLVCTRRRKWRSFSVSQETRPGMSPIGGEIAILVGGREIGIGQNGEAIRIGWRGEQRCGGRCGGLGLDASFVSVVSRRRGRYRGRLGFEAQPSASKEGSEVRWREKQRAEDFHEAIFYSYRTAILGLDRTDLSKIQRPGLNLEKCRHQDQLGRTFGNHTLFAWPWSNPMSFEKTRGLGSGLICFLVSSMKWKMARASYQFFSPATTSEVR